MAGGTSLRRGATRRWALSLMGIVVMMSVLLGISAAESNATGNTTVFPARGEVLVTDLAMGARCAVAADFDGDGKMDLVSASSNDNAVSWHQNLGKDESGMIRFSIKKKITWSSLGSRIVTVADIDGDGLIDVVGASYYDSTVRWFKNLGYDKDKVVFLGFEPNVISQAVNEGQGVAVADLDNDGDVDIATASSGDNTIAVFTNIDRGIFCDIKHVVDNNATGARTVVAADLDGDGYLDLASASKDDSTVAWYPNKGSEDPAVFGQKKIISQGSDSKGAYSLVAADINKDGKMDLVVASNGNDRVTFWRNDGKGNFDKIVIYDKADFVLSVTAVDFDRDGDMDVASASFYDGRILWYENLDGHGTQWQNHTVYDVALAQGHYVSHGDMDGDGDQDLIAVTHSENSVRVWLAATGCDTSATKDCCATGSKWNGTACVQCASGTYGTGEGASAECVPCPTRCPIEGMWETGKTIVPSTCSGTSDCGKPVDSIAKCTCKFNQVRDLDTDTCADCPAGQERLSEDIRTMDSLGNYTKWQLQQGVCEVKSRYNWRPLVYSLVAVAILAAVGAFFAWRKLSKMSALDASWTIKPEELTYDDPVVELGRGAFGKVVRGYYRGTAVAIKRAVHHGGMMSSAQSTEGSMISIDSSEQGGVRSGTGLVSDGNRSGTYTGGRTGLFSGTSSSAARSRDSFKVEMRTLANLRHPCITTIMGAVLDKELLLVTEYMSRGSLRDLLSNPNFPLDPEMSLPLIRDILSGMRFLHAADPPIVHGDLKCANVLVDENYRAKISDFGLSAKKNVAAIGTPFWMAPELLEGGLISTQSDVYSFGVTLWELMTHKIPYDNVKQPTAEITKMVRNGTLRPDCSEGLDPELSRVMDRCWSQVPGQRPTLADLELEIIPLCGQSLFLALEEKAKRTTTQQRLLQDLFPEHIARDLLAGKKVEPEQHDCVTIYFSDIVGFTTISSKLSAQEVSALLDRLYIQFDALAVKHGVFKLETIGDAWVGVCNLTEKQADHAARIARFSIDAVQAAANTPVDLADSSLGNIKIRVGFHSGPVVSSVVGTKNPRFCLFGDTMNTSSRMESTSEELHIHCSETAATLAKKQDQSLHFTSRGKIAVKGKGKMQTYWLEHPEAASLVKTSQTRQVPAKLTAGDAQAEENQGSALDVEVSIDVLPAPIQQIWEA